MLELAPEMPEKKPKIPAGEYKAYAFNFSIHRSKWGSGKKLYLWFKVFTDESNPDEYTILTRYMNYYDKPGPASYYYREWVIAKGRISDRIDRMPPSVFLNKHFRVRVNTVLKDEHGDFLIKELQYSRVTKILERIKT